MCLAGIHNMRPKNAVQIEKGRIDIQPPYKILFLNQDETALILTAFKEYEDWLFRIWQPSISGENLMMADVWLDL